MAQHFFARGIFIKFLQKSSDFFKLCSGYLLVTVTKWKFRKICPMLCWGLNYVPSKLKPTCLAPYHYISIGGSLGKCIGVLNSTSVRICWLKFKSGPVMAIQNLILVSSARNNRKYKFHILYYNCKIPL